MESNLEILYRIEDLIHTAIAEHSNVYLEESLELLNEIISDLELSLLDSQDDDENNIPFNY